MAKCQRYKSIDTYIHNNHVRYDATKDTVICNCYHCIRDGFCKHTREAIAKTCNWQGNSPNMTIKNNRPQKICPRCGGDVC